MVVGNGQSRDAGPLWLYCWSRNCSGHSGLGGGRQRRARGFRAGKLASPGIVVCQEDCRDREPLLLGAESSARFVDGGRIAVAEVIVHESHRNGVLVGNGCQCSAGAVKRSVVPLAGKVSGHELPGCQVQVLLRTQGNTWFLRGVVHAPGRSCSGRRIEDSQTS